jgi:hypothetical protein
MFIVESSSATAARKMSFVIGEHASVGLFFTMHFYVKPRVPAPAGFRLFGFPRP